MTLKKAIKRAACVILALSFMFLSVNALIDGEPYAATSDVTNSESVFSYAEVARKGDFALYADADDGHVSIKNVKTGFVLSGSVEDYESDELAAGNFKKRLISSLMIDYYDSNGNISSVVSNGMASCKGTAITNGIRIEYYFSNYGFRIPVEYTLTDAGLRASIIAAEIEEDKDGFFLAAIQLLPSFGAAGPDQQGYIMVPDGSGALIDFNQPSPSTFTYSKTIYGRDDATPLKQKTGSPSVVNMPVLGVNMPGGGFTAIATSGEANATVNAMISGVKQSYNSAYFGFVYRSADSVQMKAQAYDSRMITIMDTLREYPDTFTVNYTLMDKGQNTYSDMANIYRQYLIENKQLTKSGAEHKGLTVEFMGGIERQENVLGIPVKKVVPLTTVQDVLDVVSSLKTNELSVSAILSNFSERTTTPVIPNSLTPDSTLGSKSEFRKVLSALEELGVGVSYDVNLTDTYKSNSKTNIYDLSKTPLSIYPYKAGTFLSDTAYDPYYLLTPKSVQSAAVKLMKNKNSYPTLSLSAITLGTRLYSDFGARNHTSRNDTMNIWLEVMETLNTEGGKIAFSNANSYVFPYASVITDAPVRSGKNTMFSKDIPFYQIVLHGFVSYTVPSVNQYFDRETYFLKSIETGAAMKYLFAKRNVDKLQYTEYQEYSFIQCDSFMSEAAEYGQLNQQVLAGVAGETIVAHGELEEAVTYTDYSNNTRIIVNYNYLDVTINGKTVKARSYAVDYTID